MRVDMPKVIVERPRYNSHLRGTPHKGYKKRTRNLEDSPSYESMTARYMGGSKELNENLSPLYRYLLSKVGTPWNSVFSEICQILRSTNATQKHVRDHVDMMVVKKVKIVDDKVCDAEGNEIWFGKYYKCFYVCPAGILRVVPNYNSENKKSDDRFVFIDGEKSKQVIVDRFTRYISIKGIWFLVNFKEYNEVQDLSFDVVLKRLACVTKYKSVWNVWGDNVFACAKKQIGKREIRDVEKMWKI